MTDPAITAALAKLIADTPPPVTVWGVRYTRPTFAVPAGHIVWRSSETSARDYLAREHAGGCDAELVRVTGRVHVEG